MEGLETGIISFISGKGFTQPISHYELRSPMHNVHFGYYVYLPTEQAETYLKSCEEKNDANKLYQYRRGTLEAIMLRRVT